uniref:Uncharacterized protein n=1 Tax=Lophocladia kuetzingii TaxID=675577 RepID=A0A1Z1MPI7_9FLOR|nr:hypothetical protein [Lophocladia kuetzingii]ARW67695.1 hypothetical protein [Lophocladia kuetzingii]
MQYRNLSFVYLQTENLTGYNYSNINNTYCLCLLNCNFYLYKKI